MRDIALEPLLAGAKDPGHTTKDDSPSESRSKIWGLWYTKPNSKKSHVLLGVKFPCEEKSGRRFAFQVFYTTPSDDERHFLFGATYTPSAYTAIN